MVPYLKCVAWSAVVLFSSTCRSQQGPSDGAKRPMQLAELERAARAQSDAEYRREQGAQLDADLAKLVTLSAELKSRVDNRPAHTLSVESIRQAEEIEKLARSVKDRLKK